MVVVRHCESEDRLESRRNNKTSRVKQQLVPTQAAPAIPASLVGVAAAARYSRPSMHSVTSAQSLAKQGNVKARREMQERVIEENTERPPASLSLPVGGVRGWNKLVFVCVAALLRRAKGVAGGRGRQQLKLIVVAPRDVGTLAVRGWRWRTRLVLRVATLRQGGAQAVGGGRQRSRLILGRRVANARRSADWEGVRTSEHPRRDRRQEHGDKRARLHQPRSDVAVGATAWYSAGKLQTVSASHSLGSETSGKGFSWTSKEREREKNTRKKEKKLDPQARPPHRSRAGVGSAASNSPLLHSVYVWHCRSLVAV